MDICKATLYAKAVESKKESSILTTREKYENKFRYRPEMQIRAVTIETTQTKTGARKLMDVHPGLLVKKDFSQLKRLEP